MERYAITLVGIRPILLHNARLADPLDPITRDMKAISAKRKKTDADHIKMAELEVAGGVYRTAENLLGFPTANVWRAIFDGAKRDKLGATVQRGVFPRSDIPVLQVGGAKVDADEFAADTDNWFSAPMRVGQARVIRYRAMVRDWSTRHEFSVDTDNFDADRLLPAILDYAGIAIGLGDSRPRFGQFEAALERIG